MKSQEKSGRTEYFDYMEATIETIQNGFAAGTLTCRELVEFYLDRIEKLDRGGPRLNSIISVNPDALSQAEEKDAIYAQSGLSGPLHGIPVAFKDQGDVEEMPTTMGSILFAEHMPKRDSFVAKKLREAGAIILAKTTLGEMGAGDTHGSLFGSTKNVYDLERTAGGSSGGSGVAVSANLCATAIGQEGYASIRRPATWNGVVGMRPTAGLVSRGGVYAGWPLINGSLGPMTRSVADAARMLDAMVGFDPSDPLTARGVGKVPSSYSTLLRPRALEGRRIGILRTVMGFNSDPESEDFKAVNTIFEKAVKDLADAGSVIIDQIEIPGLIEFLEKRANDGNAEVESFRLYAEGAAQFPFATMEEMRNSTRFGEVFHGVKTRWESKKEPEKFNAYVAAREEFMTRFLLVMEENKLDAIVHKAVEHTPTLIKDGIAPPWTDQKGAPYLNTTLIFVPSIVVPAGYTSKGLPVGITFLGRPYSDAEMLGYANAFEKYTKGRKAPIFG